MDTPDKLYEQIKIDAKNNRRSPPAEVMTFLEEHYPVKKKSKNQK